VKKIETLSFDDHEIVVPKIISKINELIDVVNGQGVPMSIDKCSKCDVEYTCLGDRCSCVCHSIDPVRPPVIVDSKPSTINERMELPNFCSHDTLLAEPAGNFYYCSMCMKTLVLKVEADRGQG